MHQNLHAYLEIIREARVAHKQAQGDHYDRKPRKFKFYSNFRVSGSCEIPRNQSGRKPQTYSSSDSEQGTRIGLLQLVTHVVQNRHAGEQVTHWEKTKKENYHFKCCVLFVCRMSLRLLFFSMADLYHVNFKLQGAYVLLYDYRNRGHFGKVDESGYRKIIIHSKKVGCGPISSLQKQKVTRSTII